ncbi:MAG: DUF4097 family beta strand repeat-containing protein [Oscillospiraceae bacterium]|nr:DUF4097 family beta strand repeat-containing protein [Oscillospiraceae bacterium]
MKTLAWIRIVCWGLVLLFLTGILICSLIGVPVLGVNLNAWEGFSWRADSRVTQGDGSGHYQVPAENIKQLDINWTAGSVELVPYDGTEISFSEEAFGTLTEKNSLRYGVSDGVLVIRYVKNGLLFGNQPSKKLQVMLPRELAQSLEKIEVDSVSAKIDATDLQAGKMKYNTTSGSITLSGLQAEEIEIDTVSGGADVQDSNAENFKISTVSGDMRLDGSFQEIRSDSTSGKLTVQDRICPTTLKANSVSGDVILTLPENKGFSVSFDSLSGAFYSDFPMRMNDGEGTYENGGAHLNVDTVSGGFTIHKDA